MHRCQSVCVPYDLSNCWTNLNFFNYQNIMNPKKITPPKYLPKLFKKNKNFDV